MTKHLTSEQRYEIYLGLKRKWSRSRIAREIGVHPSMVCREIRRNRNPNGEYVWLSAQSKSDGRRHGLCGNHRKPARLWWRIERMIVDEDWSPGQIAGSWQKGAVENVNKLVRQYIPKDTDIGKLTDKYIERIRKKINSRPRKKLNFKTPKHEFYKQFEHLA